MNKAYDCVKYLLSLDDIEINIQDGIDRTPLHYAVLLKNNEILDLFLSKKNINVNLKCAVYFSSWYFIFLFCTPYTYAKLIHYDYGVEALDPAKWPQPETENNWK